MKKLLIVSIFVASILGTSKLTAADGMSETTVESKATASVELLGMGYLYSVFGSYKFIPELAANVGISYISVTSGSSSSSTLGIPLSLSFLAGGTNSHYFEVLGGGTIFATSTTVGSGLAGSLSGWVTTIGAGYRYWPKEGGLHFRATMYGFIKGGFFPWFGLSFGYAFS
ncbi:MAG: hypothetical protein H6617_08575 [Bdellovibrionaceae bacterium]|nr:hypothetical protein [Bdellovibrionales bacterium]MCB9254722.1 hypothetical protein [Pseudobdellovibrionaceae bacterium]